VHRKLSCDGFSFHRGIQEPLEPWVAFFIFGGVAASIYGDLDAAYRWIRIWRGTKISDFCRKMSIIAAPELCFVRPGEPAKKKRRSADAVALGSTQRQAKHERASGCLRWSAVGAAKLHGAVDHRD
jgi:hypothetical protein